MECHCIVHHAHRERCMSRIISNALCIITMINSIYCLCEGGSYIFQGCASGARRAQPPLLGRTEQPKLALEYYNICPMKYNKVVK